MPHENETPSPLVTHGCEGVRVAIGSKLIIAGRLSIGCVCNTVQTSFANSFMPLCFVQLLSCFRRVICMAACLIVVDAVAIIGVVKQSLVRMHLAPPNRFTAWHPRPIPKNCPSSRFCWTTTYASIENGCLLYVPQAKQSFFTHNPNKLCILLHTHAELPLHAASSA